MKKYLFACLVILLISAFVYEGYAAKSSPALVNYRWETASRSVATALPGAHDPKVSAIVSGAIQLLAVGRSDDEPQLQLFTSHDGGDSFHAIAVSEKGAILKTHGENSPVLVQGNRGPAALWDQANAQNGSDIMCAVSMNEGASFKTPMRVNDGPPDSSAYFGSMARQGKVLFAAWLDGRDQLPGGVTSLYFARSTDGGMTWQKNVRVAKDLCPCCRPSVVALANGKVLLAWRNVYEGQIRDMASAVSEDGGLTWSAPRRVAVDNWKLSGCPIAGPQLISVENRVYAAWYSHGTGKNPGIRFTSSDDAGATWQKPTIIALQDAAQPSLFQSPQGEVHLIFRARGEGQNNEWGKLQLYLARVQENGHLSAPLQLPAGQTSVAYPTAAVDDIGRFWIAWNEGGQVRMLRGRTAS